MSTEITKDVACPRCGETVATKMWPGVSAEVNPNLRERILEESFFDWSCPGCGYESRLVYPCLYHDKTRKFMVYVLPGGNLDELTAVDINERFPQLSCVKKRVVSTPEELKEKLLIFEAGLDDRAVELVKLALGALIEKRQAKTLLNGYFCFASEENNRIGFSFFLEGADKPLHQGTRLDVYHRSCEISAAHSETDTQFTAANLYAAQNMLDSYRD